MKKNEIKDEIKRLEIMLSGYSADRNYGAVQALEFRIMDLEAELYEFLSER